MWQKIKMAVPLDVLIWYLAVFRRMLVTMEQAAHSGDPEAMWLTQWAAYALHNVPDMLRNYSETAAAHRAQQVRAFPELMGRLGGPARVVKLAEALVSPQNVCEELHLAPDLSDLVLAPEQELDRHLQLLYRFCLDTRQCSPREALAEEGWHACEFLGRNNGILAGAVKNLPVALVHWSEFDPKTFSANVKAAYEHQSPWPTAES